MANFSTEEKANLLIKKFFNKASTNNATPYFQENPIYNARGTVFNDQIWADSTYIPSTGQLGGTSTTSGNDDNGNSISGSAVGKTIIYNGKSATKKYIKVPLTEVPGSSGLSYYYKDTSNNNASLLKNTIPFDFDPVGGSYEYKLYKNDGTTVINFGEGEWVLDPESGILTFYDISGVSGVSASAPPKISFYKYIGTFGASVIGSTTGGGSANNGTVTSNNTVQIVGQNNVNITATNQNISLDATGLISLNSQSSNNNGIKINSANGGLELKSKNQITFDTNIVKIETPSNDNNSIILKNTSQGGILVQSGLQGTDFISAGSITFSSNEYVSVAKNSLFSLTDQLSVFGNNITLNNNHSSGSISFIGNVNNSLFNSINLKANTGDITQDAKKSIYFVTDTGSLSVSTKNLQLKGSLTELTNSILNLNGTFTNINTTNFSITSTNSSFVSSTLTSSINKIVLNNNITNFSGTLLTASLSNIYIDGKNSVNLTTSNNFNLTSTKSQLTSGSLTSIISNGTDQNAILIKATNGGITLESKKDVKSTSNNLIVHNNSFLIDTKIGSITPQKILDINTATLSILSPLLNLNSTNFSLTSTNKIFIKSINQDIELQANTSLSLTSDKLNVKNTVSNLQVNTLTITGKTLQITGSVTDINTASLTVDNNLHEIKTDNYSLTVSNNHKVNSSFSQLNTNNYSLTVNNNYLVKATNYSLTVTNLHHKSTSYTLTTSNYKLDSSNSVSLNTKNINLVGSYTKISSQNEVLVDTKTYLNKMTNGSIVSSGILNLESNTLLVKDTYASITTSNELDVSTNKMNISGTISSITGINTLLLKSGNLIGEFTNGTIHSTQNLVLKGNNSVTLDSNYLSSTLQKASLTLTSDLMVKSGNFKLDLANGSIISSGKIFQKATDLDLELTNYNLNATTSNLTTTNLKIDTTTSSLTSNKLSLKTTGTTNDSFNIQSSGGINITNDNKPISITSNNNGTINVTSKEYIQKVNGNYVSTITGNSNLKITGSHSITSDSFDVNGNVLNLVSRSTNNDAVLINSKNGGVIIKANTKPLSLESINGSITLNTKEISGSFSNNFNLYGKKVVLVNNEIDINAKNSLVITQDKNIVKLDTNGVSINTKDINIVGSTTVIKNDLYNISGSILSASITNRIDIDTNKINLTGAELNISNQKVVNTVSHYSLTSSNDVFIKGNDEIILKGSKISNNSTVIENKVSDYSLTSTNSIYYTATNYSLTSQNIVMKSDKTLDFSGSNTNFISNGQLDFTSNNFKLNGTGSGSISVGNILDIGGTKVNFVSKSTADDSAKFKSSGGVKFESNKNITFQANQSILDYSVNHISSITDNFIVDAKKDLTLNGKEFKSFSENINFNTTTTGNNSFVINSGNGGLQIKNSKSTFAIDNSGTMSFDTNGLLFNVKQASLTTTGKIYFLGSGGVEFATGTLAANVIKNHQVSSISSFSSSITTINNNYYGITTQKYVLSSTVQTTISSNQIVLSSSSNNDNSIILNSTNGGMSVNTKKDFLVSSSNKIALLSTNDLSLTSTNNIYVNGSYTNLISTHNHDNSLVIESKNGGALFKTQKNTDMVSAANINVTASHYNATLSSKFGMNASSSINLTTFDYNLAAINQNHSGYTVNYTAQSTNEDAFQVNATAGGILLTSAKDIVNRTATNKKYFIDTYNLIGSVTNNLDFDVAKKYQIGSNQLVLSSNHINITSANDLILNTTKNYLATLTSGSYTVLSGHEVKQESNTAKIVSKKSDTNSIHLHATTGGIDITGQKDVLIKSIETLNLNNKNLVNTTTQNITSNSNNSQLTTTGFNKITSGSLSIGVSHLLSFNSTKTTQNAITIASSGGMDLTGNNKEINIKSTNNGSITLNAKVVNISGTKFSNNTTVVDIKSTNYSLTSGAVHIKSSGTGDKSVDIESSSGGVSLKTNSKLIKLDSSTNGSITMNGKNIEVDAGANYINKSVNYSLTSGVVHIKSSGSGEKSVDIESSSGGVSLKTNSKLIKLDSSTNGSITMNGKNIEVDASANYINKAVNYSLTSGVIHLKSSSGVEKSIDIEGGTGGVSIKTNNDLIKLDSSSNGSITMNGKRIEIDAGTDYINKATNYSLTSGLVHIKSSGSGEKSVDIESSSGGVSIKTNSKLIKLDSSTNGSITMNGKNIEVDASGNYINKAVNYSLTSGVVHIKSSGSGAKSVDIESASGGVLIKTNNNLINLDPSANGSVTIGGKKLEINLSGRYLVNADGGYSLTSNSYIYNKAGNNFHAVSNNLIIDNTLTSVNTNVINYYEKNDANELKIFYHPTKTIMNGVNIDLHNQVYRQYSTDYLADTQNTHIISRSSNTNAILLENKHELGGIKLDAGKGGINLTTTGDFSTNIANNFSITSGIINYTSTSSLTSAITFNASHSLSGLSFNAGNSGMDFSSEGGKIKMSTTNSGTNSVLIETTQGGVHIKGRKDTLIESTDANSTVRINSGTNGDIIVGGVLHVLNNGTGSSNVYMSGTSDTNTSSSNTSGNLNINTLDLTEYYGSNNLIIQSAANSGIYLNSGTDGINLSGFDGPINLENTGSLSLSLHTVNSNIILKSDDNVANAILIEATETTTGGVEVKATNSINLHTSNNSSNIELTAGSTGSVKIKNNVEFLDSNNYHKSIVVGPHDLSAYTPESDGSYPVYRSYISNTGSMTKVSNAILNLDQWIYKNLVDTPPKLTDGSYTTDNSKITLSWNNPTRIEMGALNIKIPHISAINVDYKPVASSWSSGDVVNINLTSDEANKLILYGASGSNGYNSGSKTYNKYGFNTNLYDFRVYGKNENAVSNNKFVYFNNVSIGAVGVPGTVTNVNKTTPALLPTLTGSLSVYWQKPADNDMSKGGIQNYPDIDKYRLRIDAVSSSRYGGVISQNITSVTSGSIISISNLNVGTTFMASITSKNIVNNNGGNTNDGYGNAGTISFISPNPTQPTKLSAFSSSAVYNYGTTTTGYKISNVSTLLNNVLNISKLSSITTFNINDRFSLNNTIGVTGSSISVLKLEDVTSSAAGSFSTLHLTTDGFGGASGSSNIQNNRFQINMTENRDYYHDKDTQTQGFYLGGKTTFKLLNMDYFYAPSLNKYTIKLNQVLEGSNNALSNFDFYVDDLDSAPAITNSRIREIDCSSNNFHYVSGLITPSTSAKLKFNLDFGKMYGYYVVRELLNYKVTANKVTNGSLVDMTGTRSVKITDFNGSTHSFFTSTTNLTVSSTKINNGYTLVRNDANTIRQINDFTCDLDSELTDNHYCEDIRINMTAYNIYGSSNVELRFQKDDTSTKKVFMDILSYKYFTTYLSNSASNIYGQKVRSGFDSSTTYYPSGPGTGANDFGDTYNNTVSILSTSPNYSKELLLANAQHITPGTAYGYSDYASAYILPANLGVGYSYPNYSTISKDTSFRFVTFKYTNVISSAQGLRMEFQNFENLGNDVINSNLTIYIKIVNSSVTSNNTAWLDANASYNVGVNSTSKLVNGTKCLSVYKSYKSTATLKYCYLDNPTTGDLYIRLGVKMNSNIKVGNIKIQNNLV